MRPIRHHLDLDSAKLPATALMSSHLDYCNLPLYGIADIYLIRFQCTESTAPPGDKVSSIYSHSYTTSFPSLFKVNFLTGKTLHETQSVYIHSTHTEWLLFHSLRSNNNNSVSFLRVKTNTDARAFNSCNSSPSVATYKKNLKTQSLWRGLSPINTSMPHGLFPRLRS